MSPKHAFLECDQYQHISHSESNRNHFNRAKYHSFWDYRVRWTPMTHFFGNNWWFCRCGSKLGRYSSRSRKDHYDSVGTFLITKSGWFELQNPTSQLYPEMDDGDSPVSEVEACEWVRAFLSEWAQPKREVWLKWVLEEWKGSKALKWLITLHEDLSIYRNSIQIAVRTPNFIICNELIVGDSEGKVT